MEFHFQRFSISQSQTPMKVGTDGVLLGAWTRGSGKQALDIGTGTGLIALMIAQNHPGLNIHAIEPHLKASDEAARNFANSPWSDRLHIHSETLQQHQSDTLYDLIVSNPPFYQAAPKAPDAARSMARQSVHLPSEELLQHTSRLLSPIRKFSNHFTGECGATVHSPGRKRRSLFKKAMPDTSKTESAGKPQAHGIHENPG